MGTRVYFGNVSINKLQEIMGIEKCHQMSPSMIFYIIERLEW